MSWCSALYVWFVVLQNMSLYESTWCKRHIGHLFIISERLSEPLQVQKEWMLVPGSHNSQWWIIQLPITVSHWEICLCNKWRCQAFCNRKLVNLKVTHETLLEVHVIILAYFVKLFLHLHVRTWGKQITEFVYRSLGYIFIHQTCMFISGLCILSDTRKPDRDMPWRNFSNTTWYCVIRWNKYLPKGTFSLSQTTHS